MKALTHNALANAVLIGNMMGDASVTMIMEHVIDCADKMARLEEENPDVWQRSELFVNDWDTVCNKLAEELSAMSKAYDSGMNVPKISKEKIKTMMGI